MSRVEATKPRVFYDTGERVIVTDGTAGTFLLTIGEREIIMDEKLAIRVITALQESLAASKRHDPRD